MQMKAYANGANIPPVCYASQFFNALMVNLVVVESQVEKQAKNERNLNSSIHLNLSIINM